MEQRRIKNMKKIMKLMLVMVMVVSLIGTSAQAIVVDNPIKALEDFFKDVTEIASIVGSELQELKETIASKFSDYVSNTWYSDCVAKLVAVGGIDGYTDGTFRPNGNITRGEFTKILIASLYGTQTQECPACHWAAGYVDKAREVGILESTEFAYNTLNTPITRQEIAKMLVLAAEKSLNEASDEDVSWIPNVIPDKNTIGSSYKTYVYLAYAKGIITGYTDKSFGPLRTATRAEASTMIVRLLDEDMRIIPEKPEVGTVIINGYVLPETNDILDWETEEPGGHLAELSVNIKMSQPLEPQWSLLERALLSQFSAEDVKEAMDYIKQKTERDQDLPPFEVYVGSRYISIWSPWGSNNIAVRVFSI